MSDSFHHQFNHLRFPKIPRGELRLVQPGSRTPANRSVFDLLWRAVLLMPFVGFAQSPAGFDYVVEDGHAVLVGNARVPGPVFEVPGKIAGLPVTEIRGWDHRSDVSAVIIPDTVTTIGPEACEHWDALRTIVVGKGVTNIGFNAFGGCFNLRAAFFLGNAPWVPTDRHSDIFTTGPHGGIWYPASDPVIVYRLAGTTGWDSFQSGIAEWARRPVEVWNGGPVIQRQPESATVYSGVRLYVDAVAPDPGPLSFQWRHEGQDLAGQTNSTLTLRGLKPAEAGSYRVVVSSRSGAATSDVATVALRVPAPGSYEAAAVALDPLAYWALDETHGTTAAEFVSGANGTFYKYHGGEVVSRPGATTKTGTSIDFHASAWVEVDATATSSLDVGSRDFTVAAWIYANAFAQSGVVAKGGYDWAPGWLFDFNAAGEGTLRLETSLGFTGGQGTVQTAPGVVTLDEWQHVAVSCHRDPAAKGGQNTSGNGWTKIYRNGGLVASGDIGAGNLDNPNASLQIARITLNNFTNPGCFPGRIDEVALFGNALSGKQIATLYAAGVGALPPLQVTRSSAGLTLTWSPGVLQSATTLGDGKSGPDWADLPTATSPHTVSSAEAARFYRVRLP